MTAPPASRFAFLGATAHSGTVDRVQVARGLACMLLVLFHVIGGRQSDGLGIGDDEPLRLLLDFLLAIRMPMFAAISGYVYALKPLDPARPGVFLRGKARRLALPLLSATTLFYLATLARQPVPAGAAVVGLLHAYVFSYAIYWFLQAMLLIFLILPLLERRVLHSPWGIGAAIAIAFLLTVPAEPIDFLSINGAFFLAPYFFVGIAARRFITLTPAIVRLALAVLVVALGVHLAHVLTLPAGLRGGRGTAVALVIGAIVPVLTIAYAPRIRWIAKVGAASFAIFLFHIFFVVPVRAVLLKVGVEDVATHILIGMAAGLIGPMVLERLLLLTPPIRRLFLGLR
ncbi:acyltransferase [Sphingomonas naphthae]|uniref:Acyltransferase n=1 Tax=Sphingomonas naphthae TaxID=1813468 RepID=A0ABY7TGC9_9SPHN|nr:acyltransferase [Sphingomonas naphthae]WCT71888.1 acyltransferase [Sphingomonas naphthae]